MKRVNKLVMILLIMVTFNPITHLKATPLGGLTQRNASVSAGNVAIILLGSFLIGNAVSWIMGAYPKDYPTIPFTEEETSIIHDLKNEVAQYPDEPEIKAELGEIYFQHNQLDLATDYLESAVALDSENAETLAIYSANEAKQAGAMWDFTWGIMKLGRMDDAVDGLNHAVELDPENPTVRLYRMNTLIGFKDKRNNFHRVFEDENWFTTKLSENPSYFPATVKQHFYKAMQSAYRLAADFSETDEEKSMNLKKAEQYRLTLAPFAQNN